MIAPLMTLPLIRVLFGMLSAATNRTSIWLLLAVNLVSLPAANAQDTQYISDMVLVPVRSGAGSEFPIVDRGLPSRIPGFESSHGLTIQCRFSLAPQLLP